MAGICALAVAITLPATASSQTRSGGLATEESQQSDEGQQDGTRQRRPARRARLTGSGRAIPPRNAPRRVVRAIRAANQIRNHPYRYGGGHARWRDRGYDCSGAISYALGRPGARILRRPTNSTGFMSWGNRGRGNWITVYTNPGHAYVEIAGLRFDTSGTGGKGPRWQKAKRSHRGFMARNFRGL